MLARKQCPRCGNKYVFRSHRRPLEKPFLDLFHLAPLRCDACEKRFYARVEKSPATSTATSLLSRG